MCLLFAVFSQPHISIFHWESLTKANWFLCTVQVQNHFWSSTILAQRAVNKQVNLFFTATTRAPTNSIIMSQNTLMATKKSIFIIRVKERERLLATDRVAKTCDTSRSWVWKKFFLYIRISYSDRICYFPFLCALFSNFRFGNTDYCVASSWMLGGRESLRGNEAVGQLRWF